MGNHAESGLHSSAFQKVLPSLGVPPRHAAFLLQHCRCEGGRLQVTGGRDVRAIFVEHSSRRAVFSMYIGYGNGKQIFSLTSPNLLPSTQRSLHELSKFHYSHR